MADTLIVWTALPFGRIREGEHEGLYRVSVVVSPRLTPQAPDEQTLGAFPAWLNWPATLEAARFGIRIGPMSSSLLPISKPDGGLWKRFFDGQTPVAGFVYKDFSAVNIHSYPVRNVLDFARRTYGGIAATGGDEHPTLLPWGDADPKLRGMLETVGTRTAKITLGDREIEVMAPGFSRFHGEENKTDATIRRQVFGRESVYGVDVPGTDAEDAADRRQGLPARGRVARRRVMSPDWVNPRPGGPGAPLAATPDAALMDQFSTAEEYALYQADRFYRRKRPTAEELAKARPDFVDKPPRPIAPDYDFHRIVASYSDYGGLLRALGLVIDFAVEDGSEIETRVASGGGEGVGQMQLRLEWEGTAPGQDALPRMAWLGRRDRFVPRPRENRHAAGLLRLEDSDDGWNQNKDDRPGQFDLYTVDPDGAAIKTVNFTLTAQNLLGKSLSTRQKHGETTYTTGDRQPLAALRSCGIGVSQHGRAIDLARTAAAADDKNKEIVSGNAESVVLFAEDVLRGYRPDIAEVPDYVRPGDWRTLCARTGTYRLLRDDSDLNFPEDEGFVSGMSVTGDEATDEHYMHESLFRWTGWSLVASRPGKTIRAETNENDELQAEVPSEVTDTAVDGNNLAVSFAAAKGTLPKLRFGRTYRVRARLVDLAGNSLDVDDPSLEPLEQASDAIGYWRFEPVDPPVLVHRHKISEGESLERMVIRSNFDMGTAEYITSPGFLAELSEPGLTDFEYREVNERHVVPPKSSQQQCETHGLFDPFFGDWAKIRDGYAIAAREAGTLYDDTPGSQVSLVTPVAMRDVATTATIPPALPDAENPVGDRMIGGQYITHEEDRVLTPYLADGAAGGVAIRAAHGHTIPGVTGAKVLGQDCRIVLDPSQNLVILVRRGDGWPTCDGFRLIVAERRQSHTETPCDVSFPDDGEPVWDDEKRTLTFFLFKGQIARLRYSSFIHPEFVSHFGMPKWTGSDQNYHAAQHGAMLGTNWLMTPYRKLVLVHATQAPVCLPELENLSISRQDGASDARLLCRTVRLHGPSTGKIEIEAEWSEWIDDPGKPAPFRKTFRGQLGEIRLNEGQRDEFVLGQAVEAQRLDPEAKRGDVQDFGDSRFRLVKYRCRATTRFREYLPPSMYDKPELTSRLGPVAEGPSVDLPAEDDPGAPVLRAPGGSTTQSLVPATVAPKDPKLLYVVPTFRWSERPERGDHDVTRLGNGLRVWLDRPWFTSGDGELLGVVIHREGGEFTDVPKDMQLLVSQWGMDPLWGTALPKKLVRETDFAARVTEQSVRLQERPEAPAVKIIGHRVHWDDARGLWYADIELEPGASYMPFVRLALVRYQPNALPNARISKVVLADYSQLLPRRRLVAMRSGDKISIRLHGPNPEKGPINFSVDSAHQFVSLVNGPFETGRNRVEVVLQVQDPGIDSELGWRDEKTLSESVVGETDDDRPGRPDLTITDVGGRIVRRAAGGTTMIPSAVERQLTEMRSTIESAVGGFTATPIDPFAIDPAFWADDVALPSGGGRRRIMVREFERFYSDNSVKERVGRSTYHRRIIEERLVYADTFDPEALLV